MVGTEGIVKWNPETVLQPHFSQLQLSQEFVTGTADKSLRHPLPSPVLDWLVTSTCTKPSGLGCWLETSAGPLSTLPCTCHPVPERGRSPSRPGLHQSHVDDQGQEFWWKMRGEGLLRSQHSHNPPRNKLHSVQS